MLDGGSRAKFKPREERRKVALQARMLSDCGWDDACILNLSSGGLLVYSDAQARPGSYVELRRGQQVIVARVVWRQDKRIGLNSQSRLVVEDIMRGTGGVAALQLGARGMSVERRRLPRHDQSRLRGRAAEFAIVAMFGAALASLAFTGVKESLTKPMAKVTASLKAR